MHIPIYFNFKFAYIEFCSFSKKILASFPNTHRKKHKHSKIYEIITQKYIIIRPFSIYLQFLKTFFIIRKLRNQNTFRFKVEFMKIKFLLLILIFGNVPDLFIKCTNAFFQPGLSFFGFYSFSTKYFQQS